MPFQIIDTHQHLWDLDRVSLPWVKNIPQLNRSFDQEDYSEYTRSDPESEIDYEIMKTVYTEVDVAESDLQTEMELVLGYCRNHESPLAGMIAGSRPGTKDFEQSIEFAISNPEIKGFRRVLHTDATPRGTCLQQDFQSSIRTLSKHSLTFDLCMRRDELTDAARLAKSCPETQLVLDHCGNADVRISDAEFKRWKHDINSVAECDNVVCKVSGFGWTIQNKDWSYEKDIKPILRVVFESFGSEKIMFGGDWPVCTLSALSFPQWVHAIRRFAQEYSEEAEAKLFRTNAERVYRLET